MNVSRVANHKNAGTRHKKSEYKWTAQQCIHTNKAPGKLQLKISLRQKGLLQVLLTMFSMYLLKPVACGSCSEPRFRHQSAHIYAISALLLLFFDVFGRVFGCFSQHVRLGCLAHSPTDPLNPRPGESFSGHHRNGSCTISGISGSCDWSWSGLVRVGWVIWFPEKPEKPEKLLARLCCSSTHHFAEVLGIFFFVKTFRGSRGSHSSAHQSRVCQNGSSLEP